MSKMCMVWHSLTQFRHSFETVLARFGIFLISTGEGACRAKIIFTIVFVAHKDPTFNLWLYSLAFCIWGFTLMKKLVWLSYMSNSRVNLSFRKPIFFAFFCYYSKPLWGTCFGNGLKWLFFTQKTDHTIFMMIGKMVFLQYRHESQKATI